MVYKFRACLKRNINTISSEGSSNYTRILNPDQILTSVTFHPPNQKLIITATTYNHSNEIYIGSLDSKSIKRLTNSNPVLNDIALSRQETISWRAKDGLFIHGVLTYPLKYKKGKRYPLVLQIHGGPEGTSLDGWNTS